MSLENSPCLIFICKKNPSSLQWQSLHSLQKAESQFSSDCRFTRGFTFDNTRPIHFIPSSNLDLAREAKIIHHGLQNSGINQVEIQHGAWSRNAIGGSLVRPGRGSQRDIRQNKLSRRWSKSMVRSSWRRWCDVLHFRLYQFIWVSQKHLSIQGRQEFLTVFSVYQEYYQSHQLQDQSPSSISWIGSLQVFFLFAVGVVGGPLFDPYGAKVCGYSCAVLRRLL